MIREVTHYETADGKVFPTEQQAMRHAEELLLHKLEALVNAAFPNIGHRPSVIQAVKLMASNRKATADQLRGVLNILEHGE
ncbi:TPA: hypothetical protein L3889_000535 [Pseudomonas aeruginosa]|uniref:hypothetical protein n=1 Tax=unclassified Pseudomonas TaxID=196821 RepID=UPI00215826FC|nr:MULTISPECIES: hypothetical protein [unclassified Pseudomonas]HBN9515530.1 hypothetical protein [Pseudomonas aeruginosa]